MLQSSMSNYKLSCALSGHGQDIKSVVAVSNDVILSASRDGTSRLWHRKESNQFKEEKLFLGHNGFVNSIAFLSQSDDNGFVITGGSDKTINVFKMDGPDEPLFTLVGHTDNVCSLYASKDGELISGSWDKTARVWEDWTSLYILQGHSQAVWAVSKLNGLYLTASADKTIKSWRRENCEHTFSGHKDCVRALCNLGEYRFASCSNDGTVRIWDIKGDCLEELHGHTSFIYALSALDSQNFCSSGEDRSVRIWSGKDCIETFFLPATSVWTVSSMENGDIVTGCNDGVIRVFTRSKERVAPGPQLKEFSEQLSSYTMSAKTVGDLQTDKLEGEEALNAPGKKDGEVKMIKIRGIVEAHQWSGSESRWVKIGEVVDAIGQGRKQLFKGKEYDYVFDVDVEDGKPPLKLPYNLRDNIYQTAEKFLIDNNLPSSYLDQVVDFIQKNTQGQAIGSTPKYNDPFTGDNRYIPSTEVNSMTTTSTISSKKLPNEKFLFFTQVNIEAIKKKLVENNENFVKSKDASKVLGRFEEVIKFIDQLPSNEIDSTSVYPIILQIIEVWPIEAAFPAVDLLRYLIYHDDSCLKGNQILQDVVGPAVLRYLLMLINDIKDSDKSWNANVMLFLRSLTNMCHIEGGKTFLLQRLAELLEICNKCSSLKNVQIQIALAALFLNISILLVRKEHLLKEEFIQCIATYTFQEEELVIRAITAMGNLLVDNAVSAGVSAKIITKLEYYSSCMKSAQINELIMDLSLMI